MVDNVIENAVRHNQPHGSITVALERHGEHALLVVENGGPFLDPTTVAQLPEPFKRLRADRTGSENGHGLGLSIVAAIAAAHDGTSSCTPDPKADCKYESPSRRPPSRNPLAHTYEGPRRRRRALTGEHHCGRVA